MMIAFTAIELILPKVNYILFSNIGNMFAGMDPTCVICSYQSKWFVSWILQEKGHNFAEATADILRVIKPNLLKDAVSAATNVSLCINCTLWQSVCDGKFCVYEFMYMWEFDLY